MTVILHQTARNKQEAIIKVSALFNITATGAMDGIARAALWTNPQMGYLIVKLIARGFMVVNRQESKGVAVNCMYTVTATQLSEQ